MSETKPILYLAVGDSLTEGIGAQAQDKHWVAQFFHKLLKHSDSCRLRNLGISGMTTKELLNFVTTDALKRIIPQATHISVSTGGCDFIELYLESDRKKSRLLDKMDEVCTTTKIIMNHIRSHNSDATLYLMGFYLPRPAYSEDIDLATVTIQEMNKKYKNICKKHNATLINPFTTFLNKQDDYFADEVHPNQDGYNKLTELIMTLINKI